MLSIKRVVHQVSSAPRRFVSVLDVHDAFSEKHPDAVGKVNNTFDSSSSRHPETQESQIARPQGVANSEPSATAQTLRKENHPDPASVKGRAGIWFGFYI